VVTAFAATTATGTYALTGFNEGVAVPLGSWIAVVPGGATFALPPLRVPSGAYDALLIDVQGSAPGYR
jgi:hypothetical protein